MGTNPQSITPHPTDCSPARAAAANMGPDARASRASTTLALPDSRASMPKPEENRLTSSGVSPAPMIPRTPETLMIKLSCMPSSPKDRMWTLSIS